MKKRFIVETVHALSLRRTTKIPSNSLAGFFFLSKKLSKKLAFMLNFCYLCSMKKKTTIDIIGESERTTLYSIIFEMKT